MRRIMSLLLAGWFIVPTAAVAVVEKMPGSVITPTLILNHIQAVKSSEGSGDELYLSLSVNHGNKSTSYLRIPEKPIHWTASYLDKIKQLTIWSDSLQDGESVSIMVSLVESDDSVLNPDDVIGNIQVKFKNQNGVLETKWSMPNRMEGPTAVSGKKGEIQKFLFMGEDGAYELFFSQQLHDKTNVKVGKGE
jgi:hypothetical protein